MRRFCLYKRGRIWYCKLYNSAIKRYLSGRSTGEIQRDAALLIVAKWLSGGLPDPMTKGVRPLADIFEVDAILNAVRSTPLTTSDAERIVAALRARELLETAVAKASSGSEHFITFLKRFWNYDVSPYVRDKLAHEHSIGRRHCYEMGLSIQHYWKPYFNDRRMIEIRKNDLQAFDSGKVKKAVEYWRSRRVSYHSWRHLWAARMADRLEARKVMSATGHKSGAVFEVYADHVTEKTLMEVQEVSEDTFGRLLPFRPVSEVSEESKQITSNSNAEVDEVDRIGIVSNLRNLRAMVARPR